MIEQIGITERIYSQNHNGLSVGIANIRPNFEDIKTGKQTIEQIIDYLKLKSVNLIVFPEFSLGGLPDEHGGNGYQQLSEGMIEKHIDWIEAAIESKLDEQLQAVVINIHQRGSSGSDKFLNTTFWIAKGFDLSKPNNRYLKTFIPKTEQLFFESGQDDRLVIETSWGKLGFTTCYDFCFADLLKEYTLFDHVDGIITTACWRAGKSRRYEGLNIGTESYYGYLWNTLMPAMAAMNQVWVISSNAVGHHPYSDDRFWGGSGIWAPSGLNLLQASHEKEELIILHNLDLKEARTIEKNDFDYISDFWNVYEQILDRRTVSRIKNLSVPTP